MTRHERRRFEMFTRVQEFGKANHDQFPDGSATAKSLGALDVVVAELARLDSGRIAATRAGQEEKAIARRDLVAQMAAMARTAKVLAGDIPGIQSKFLMPRRYSDVAILSTARAFASHTPEFNERFVEHGLPEGKVFETMIDAFDGASRGRQATKNNRTGAQADIHKAIARGLTIVRTLDVVIANTMSANPGLTAKWKQARRVVSGVRPAASENLSSTGTAPVAVAPSTTDDLLSPVSDTALQKAS